MLERNTNSNHYLQSEGQAEGGVAKSILRSYPVVTTDGKATVEVKPGCDDEIRALMGMKTKEAAEGVFVTALEALGVSGKEKAQMIAAMYAEVDPRDGIEAMLVAQMTATHVAMTTVSAKLTGATMSQVRESWERSMTRLSRTYLAQMDALKKYRAKAQQVVRVERVTVRDGGQAIVGNLQSGGAGDG